MAAPTSGTENGVSPCQAGPGTQTEGRGRSRALTPGSRGPTQGQGPLLASSALTCSCLSRKGHQDRRSPCPQNKDGQGIHPLRELDPHGAWGCE